MDMSVGAAQKAITKADKQEHIKKGQCFHCSRRGHLTQSCPDKPPKIATTSAPKEEALPQYEKLTKREKLADYALKLSDEERDAFIRKVIGEDNGQGFQEA